MKKIYKYFILIIFFNCSCLKIYTNLSRNVLLFVDNIKLHNDFLFILKQEKYKTITNNYFKQNDQDNDLFQYCENITNYYNNFIKEYAIKNNNYDTIINFHNESLNRNIKIIQNLKRINQLVPEKPLEIPPFLDSLYTYYDYVFKVNTAPLIENKDKSKKYIDSINDYINKQNKIMNNLIQLFSINLLNEIKDIQSNSEYIKINKGYEIDYFFGIKDTLKQISNQNLLNYSDKKHSNKKSYKIFIFFQILLIIIMVKKYNKNNTNNKNKQQINNKIITGIKDNKNNKNKQKINSKNFLILSTKNKNKNIKKKTINKNKNQPINLSPNLLNYTNEKKKDMYKEEDEKNENKINLMKNNTIPNKIIDNEKLNTATGAA